MPSIRYRTVEADGFKVFYREAGNSTAPKLLLLHGFPTSSHMFRDLIPLVADRFHTVAPDLPGFGLSDMPPREKFSYTFDNIAGVVERFTEVIGFDRFAIYVFDYGAPAGFRLAVHHPERITAIISQNGNAYEEGLSDGWTPIRAYWENPSQANRNALRAFLTPETTHGSTHTAYLTRQLCRRTVRISTTFILRVPVPTKSSSTCLVITRAMWRCIRRSRNTSAPTSDRCWRCGARMTRSSCRPEPKLSNGTTATRSFVSLTLATSRWKPTPGKSPTASVIS
jgi:pimeloyl-ACP methyl ester carboxylesterase